MRKIHICPQCGRIFKNFKWRKDHIYDEVACCPKCNLPVHKWCVYKFSEINIKEKEIKK